MKKKIKMRKIKSFLRCIRREFGNEFLKGLATYQEKREEEIKQALRDYFQPIIEDKNVIKVEQLGDSINITVEEKVPKQELVYIPEKDIYVDRYMQNGKGELFEETDILRLRKDIK